MIPTHKNYLGRRCFLFLLGFFIVSRLVTMAIVPIFDPSEARYATMGRNMAETGNFRIPQFVHQGVFQTFDGKPPLFFQSSGVCCKIFGINEFAVRLPALFSALAILAFLYYTVKLLRDAERARLGTILCMGIPVFYIFAGLCMTDLMLAGSAVGAVMSYMLFSARRTRRQEWLGSVLFFACLGVGMMVKGPVALVMAGLPILAYIIIDHRWKDLKRHAWFTGILVFLLIAAPWYILMTQDNPDFLEYFFINENFKRFLFHEYGDKYGAGRESFRGMALIFFLACNAPFVLHGIILACRPAWRKVCYSWKMLHDPMVGLASLTILTNTLFWCLTSRVLLTYLLPTIPMVAILLSEFILNLRDQTVSDWTKWTVRLASTLVVLCAAVLCVVSVIGYKYTEKLPSNIYQYAASLEEYKDCPIYVMNKTPYSAEFYLGNYPKGRCVIHAKQGREEDLESSKDAVLVLSQSDLDKLDYSPESVGRKRIHQMGFWYVYAPLSTTPKKETK